MLAIGRSALKNAPVKRKPIYFVRCLAGTVLTTSMCSSPAAVPFDSATITRLENKVTVGDISGGKAGGRHVASVSDVVKANNFVQTASESRAELTFADKSLVRVGQNSVFTFDANSRTLDLKKGDMLFYVPPGSGGGTIKTPGITAAITGTLCKVTEDMIAVLRGSITIFCGKERKKLKIQEGFAVKVVNGECVVFQFDPNQAAKGKLYSWGPLPENLIEGITVVPNAGNTQLNGQVNPNVNNNPPPPPTGVAGPTTPPPPPPPPPPLHETR